MLSETSFFMKTIKKAFLFYSPAKINLNLHILAKRKDGYHELETDLVPIDFWDSFALLPATPPQINQKNTDQKTIDQKNTDQKKIQKNYKLSDKEDLTCKAIELLEQTSKTNFGFQLKVEKTIPCGAGLGGGSSNAAAVLFAFNQIFSLGFDLKKLAQLGKQLGADVPFFLHQKQLRMGGIGEKIIQTINIPNYPLLLLIPDFQSNTKEAYQNYKPSNSSPPQKTDYRTTGIKKISVKDNHLYPSVLKTQPLLKNYLQILKSTQPLTVQMSGSGSSLFAVYETLEKREIAWNELNPLKKEQQKEQQNFTLYKTQILPTFDFFLKNVF